MNISLSRDHVSSCNIFALNFQTNILKRLVYRSRGSSLWDSATPWSFMLYFREYFLLRFALARADFDMFSFPVSLLCISFYASLASCKSRFKSRFQLTDAVFQLTILLIQEFYFIADFLFNFVLLLFEKQHL